MSECSVLPRKCLEDIALLRSTLAQIRKEQRTYIITQERWEEVAERSVVAIGSDMDMITTPIP